MRPVIDFGIGFLIGRYLLIPAFGIVLVLIDSCKNG